MKFEVDDKCYCHAISVTDKCHTLLSKICKLSLRAIERCHETPHRPHRILGLWTFRSQDVSFPERSGRFVPWTFRSLDDSFPGRFAPWTFHSIGRRPSHRRRCRVGLC